MVVQIKINADNNYLNKVSAIKYTKKYDGILSTEVRLLWDLDTNEMMM
jgi:hypothetical protein